MSTKAQLVAKNRELTNDNKKANRERKSLLNKYNRLLKEAPSKELDNVKDRLRLSNISKDIYKKLVVKQTTNAKLFIDKPWWSRMFYSRKTLTKLLVNINK